jgi:hypothetical protein
VPSWAWLLTGIFIGAPVGLFTFALLSAPAFRDLEGSELEARQENRRLNGLLAEITDTKEAA